MKVGYQYAISHGWYIDINIDGSFYDADGDIAEWLGIPEGEYADILIEQFNGISISRGVYFEEEDDAEDAAMWLEPKILPGIIAAKLRGEV